MSFVVSCPRCATRLKSAQPIPAGRSVACPRCKFVFHPPEDPPTGIAPLPIPAPAVLSPPPLPLRAAPDESIPAAVILDEPEPDLSRSRNSNRTRDDEDDRPVVRPRDDEGDIPRFKSRRSPRRKPVLLLLIGGGIGLVLLLIAVGAILLIADPFHWRGGASSEMLAWAPADASAVVYMDVDSLRKHEKFRDSIRAGPAGKLGLSADDVSALLLAGRTFGGLDGEVTVLRLRSSPNQDQFVRATGGTTATANGKTYYRTKDGGGLYFPGGRIVVLTRTTTAMNSLLQKQEGKVVISEDLREVTSRGQGDFWMASLLPGGVLGPGFPVFPAGGGQPRSMLMCFTLSGSTGEVRTEATFPNAEAARQAAAGAESVRPQVVGKKNWTYSVTTSGNTMIITSSGPLDEDKPMFPF